MREQTTSVVGFATLFSPTEANPEDFTSSGGFLELILQFGTVVHLEPNKSGAEIIP